MSASVSTGSKAGGSVAVAEGLLLADALERLGRYEEAAEACRAAVVADACSSEAHRRFASALLRLGKVQDALLSADKAAVLDPNDAAAWVAFGLALRACGDLAHAALSLERAARLDPNSPVAFAQLGSLYDELDRPLDAEDRLLRAVRLDPADKQSHVNLSSLYCRAARFGLGRRYALSALALDPTLFAAHQNLAGIYEQEGKDEEAKRHRDLAYRACNLLFVPGRSPRRRVLVLASADSGNSPDRHLLPQARYDRLIWFVEYADAKQMAVPPACDVVFNAIGDPDSSGSCAATLKAFLRTCAKPLLNQPKAIARTARVMAQDLFSGIEGLEVPSVVRVKAEALAAFGVEAVRRAGAAPLLIRPVGSHGGKGLVLLRSLDDKRDVVEAVVPGRDHYVSAFRDYRSADGLYRKYRMFFVDRKPFPYHLAISSHWLVHYQTSGVVDHPDRLAEERRFLDDPEKALGGPAMRAIGAMGRRLDLDFCGADFAVLQDGAVLLFEANATMLVHPEAPDGPLAHKNPPVRRILEAFWERLENA